MTLYVNIYEKLLNDTTNIFGLGGLIRIGNSSYSNDYFNGGIFLQPGLHTFISVEREFKSILPKPYSNCEVESDLYKFEHVGSYLYDLIDQSEYAYSQHLCVTQCLQKYLIEKHNCTFFTMPSLFNVSLCDFDLYLKITYSNELFKNEFINRNCLPLCPLECNQTLYKPSITSYQLIGGHFLGNITNNPNLNSDFIRRQIDLKEVQNSIVQVSVFYETLSYKMSCETPKMNLVSLFASIGGNLGLFMGVCVFSFCEMIEVIIEIFFILKIKTKASF